MQDSTRPIRMSPVLSLLLFVQSRSENHSLTLARNMLHNASVSTMPPVMQCHDCKQNPSSSVSMKTQFIKLSSRRIEFSNMHPCQEPCILWPSSRSVRDNSKSNCPQTRHLFSPDKRHVHLYECLVISAAFSKSSFNNSCIHPLASHVVK